MPAGYDDEEKDGVLIGAIIEGGAADKAGLKTGDRIVALAGQPVKNIQSYMVLMRRQKVGQEVEVGVIRKGKKLTVKVKPQ
jgi:serine protease DegQ